MANIVDLSDATIAGLAAALKGPVQETYTASSPGVEDRLDKLYDATNAIASKLDANARIDANSAATFARAVTEMRTAIVEKRGSGRGDDGSAKANTNYLRDVATSTRGLLAASKNCGIEVNICKISANVMKDITSAVRTAMGAATTKKEAIGPVVRERRPGKQLSKVMGNSIDDLGDRLLAAGDDGGGGPTGPAGAGKAGSRLKSFAKGIEKFGYIVAAAASKMTEALGVDAWNILPNIKAANEFRVSINMLAFRTQGYVGDNKELASTYFDLTAEANRAGVTLETFQIHAMKSAERGLNKLSIAEKKAFKDRYKALGLEKVNEKLRQKEQDRTNRVTATALHTAQMLRMDVSATNDLFTQWHMQLGMSANRMSQIGRHMEKIQRSSGISGVNLQNAVASADKLAKLLKSAGGFTGVSGENIIELTALYEKHGVGDVMNRQLEARTSSEAFEAASQDTKNALIAIAGAGGGGELVGRVQFGRSLQTRKDQKLMAEGRIKMVQTYLKGYTTRFKNEGLIKQGGSIKDLDLTDLSAALDSINFSSSEWMSLNNLMRKTLGGGVGDQERIIKAEQEWVKDTSAAMKDLRDKIVETKKSFTDSSDAVRGLQRELEELKTDQFESMFSKTADALKKFPAVFDDAGIQIGGGIDEFMSNEKAKRKHLANLADLHGEDAAKAFMKDIGSMRTSGLKYTQSLEKRTGKLEDISGNKLTLKAIVEAQGYKGGLEKLQRDLTHKDPDRMRAAQSALVKAREDISHREMVSSDNVADARDKIRRMHNKGQDITQHALMYIVNLLGSKGIVIASIVGGLGGAAVAAVAAVAGAGFLSRFLAPAATATAATGVAGWWAKSRLNPKTWSGKKTPTTGPQRKASPRQRLKDINKKRAASGRAPLTRKTLPGTRPSAVARGPRRLGKGRMALLALLGDQLTGGHGLDWINTKIGGLFGNKPSGGGGVEEAAAFDVSDVMPVSITNWEDSCVCAGAGAGAGGAGGAGQVTGKDMVGAPPQYEELPPPTDYVGNAMMGAYGIHLVKNAKEGLKTTKAVTDATKTLTDATKVSRLAPLKAGAANLASKLPGASKATAFLQGTSKTAGALRGVGAIAKRIPLIDTIVGGVLGGMDAEYQGMSVGSGIGYGVLTGGAGTGTEDKFFSGYASRAMGIEQGSNRDEQIGALGSTTRGALIGAAFGGPIGAAAGALVGTSVEVGKVLHAANREVDLMGENLNKFDVGYAKRTQEIVDKFTKGVSDPIERIKEIDRLISSKKILLGGTRSNLRDDRKERAGVTNWLGMNPHARALNESIESGQRKLATMESALAKLQEERNKALKEKAFAVTDQKGAFDKKAGKEASAEALAKAMKDKSPDKDAQDRANKQMLMPGSIYTHDAHCESVLIKMLHIMMTGTKGTLSAIGTGAFAKGQTTEARDSGIVSFVKSIWNQVFGAGANLKSSEEERRSAPNNVVNALNKGAFDRENIHDAKRESASEYIARVTGSSHAGASQNITKELSKLYNPMDFDRLSIESSLSNTLGLSAEDFDRMSIESSLSNTLGLSAEDFDPQILGNANSRNLDYSEATKGIVKGLDYSEQTKGIVNTLLTNRAQIESNIERRKYGDVGEGSSIIPGMSEIGAYLMSTQAEKLSQMITLLASIDAKVGPGEGTTVIGPNGKRQRHLPHGGVNMNVLAQPDSSWGLTYSDSQPGDLTTEGSGIYG